LPRLACTLNRLSKPVDRQVLVHAQVAHQCPQPGPVAGGGACLRGEDPGGGGPAGAQAPLGPVLAHTQAQWRQVEHLPGLDPGYQRAGQLLAAAAAPVRDVPGKLVRLGDLGQMGAGRAGLLAGPAPLGPLASPPLRLRGLAQAV
jgi:hypothetical protein